MNQLLGTVGTETCKNTQLHTLTDTNTLPRIKRMHAILAAIAYLSRSLLFTSVKTDDISLTLRFPLEH